MDKLCPAGGNVTRVALGKQRGRSSKCETRRLRKSHCRADTQSKAGSHSLHARGHSSIIHSSQEGAAPGRPLVGHPHTIDDPASHRTDAGTPATARMSLEDTMPRGVSRHERTRAVWLHVCEASRPIHGRKVDGGRQGLGARCFTGRWKRPGGDSGGWTPWQGASCPELCT